MSVSLHVANMRTGGADNALWKFVCQSCSSEYPFGAQFLGCPACKARGASGLLELTPSYRALPKPPAERAPLRGLLRYADVLPIDQKSWISLGEGATALVRSHLIGPKLGLKNLWFKLEQQNPTQSFKDRFVSVSVNAARLFGYRRVAVSSTGNFGISAAAYCAAAGMKCLVLVPEETPGAVIDEAALLGGNVVALRKGDRFGALELVAKSEGWFPLGLFLNRPVQNPFGVEGYRTIAYEIIDELGRAPDAVMFPCARGNGLYGTWKGFRDAFAWKWTGAMPRMVACQPAGANSLEVSLDRGSQTAIELPPFDSVAKSTSETVASDKALDAVRESKGAARSAAEDEIVEAVRLLGREGLNVEASSALPVACLPKMRGQPGFSADDHIVCVLTASGQRWSDQYRASSSPRAPMSLDEFQSSLASGAFA